MDAIGAIVPLDGRYQFPAEDPSKTKEWILTKWLDQLKLPRLEAASEADLEEWADEVGELVPGCRPGLHTFLQAIRLNSTPTYKQSVTNLLAAQKAVPTTLDDVITVLCKDRFEQPHVGAHILERKLRAPQRGPTTEEAYTATTKLLRNYGYICKRHCRYCIVGEIQLAELLLATIPIVVEERFDCFARTCSPIPRFLVKRAKRKKKSSP